MEEKTLTLRLDRILAEDVEAYAARHDTTLHEPVAEREPTPEETPIL